MARTSDILAGLLGAALAHGALGGPGGPGGRGGRRTGADGESFGEPPLDGVRPRASDAEAETGPRGPVPSPQFVIEEHAGALVFSTERGSRRLRADGEKRKRDGADGRAREVVARWHEGGLEVKTGGPRRAMKERHRLREDGRLQIDFELGGPGPMPTVKFRLLYARPALGAAEPR